MKSSRFIIVPSIAACAIAGAAAVANGQLIPHPGQPSPQRAVATEWVRYINSGDQRDACYLQIAAEVNGRPCGELPTRQVLHCPKNAVVRKPSPHELRRSSEQIGSITEEASDRAFAVLKSQRKASKWRGTIGLERSGATWRISYVRQGDRIYQPAGTVWLSETWRTLWYPLGCSRREARQVRA